MIFPESMGIRNRLGISSGGGEKCFPDWAKAELWLGWWCRHFQQENTRLFVTAVLPSRAYAAAFSGLGALIAGGSMFQGGFSWNEYRSLPVGSEIHWKDTGDHRFAGIIREQDPRLTNMVRVEIIQGRGTGVVQTVSEARFNEFTFSEDRLPSSQRTSAMQRALHFQQTLGLTPNPRWITNSTPEARIATNMKSLRRSLDGIRLTVDGVNPISFSDALCYGTDNATKIILSAVRSIPERKLPLTILDGSSAFFQIQEISSGNVLLFVDRTEFTDDINDVLIGAESEAIDFPLDISTTIPDCLPPGFEISAFILPSQL